MQMNKFYGVLIYLAIGGVVVAPAAVNLQRDCGLKLSITEFSVSAAIWPALLSSAVAVAFMDTEGLSECKK